MLGGFFMTVVQIKNMTLDVEFNRQVENLIQKGYPVITRVNDEEFRKKIEPLRDKIQSLETELQQGHILFAIVINSDWVGGEQAMPLVEREGKKGFSVMDDDDIRRFKPIQDVQIPDGFAYLMLGINTGKDTLNVTPNEAMKTIQNENHSPLTVEEGIAVVTHYPDMLKKNNGFSLLGSRCGDRRVTALWISGGKPKLGWCWAGNPHTWLGSASCRSRVGLTNSN
jgi:hypothetical protein